MESAEKCSSSSASMDGTAAMDVGGVMFLSKRLKDVDAMKTTCYRSSFTLEISCCGWRWVGKSDIEMWMVVECGIG